MFVHKQLFCTIPPAFRVPQLNLWPANTLDRAEKMAYALHLFTIKIRKTVLKNQAYLHIHDWPQHFGSGHAGSIPQLLVTAQLKEAQ